MSDGTLERIEMAFDDLATAYPRPPSAELLSAVRAHLGYTTSLLDGRAVAARGIPEARELAEAYRAEFGEQPSALT